MIANRTQEIRTSHPVCLRQKRGSADTAPVVSILCATYNHESFIEQCLESFLMQETTFPVEIIVHDDASTDRTNEVLRAYQESYPHIFRLILQNENQMSQGKRILPVLIGHATGRYCAICEGDDYWTSPHKLQRQVDFLDSHPECCGSFHNVLVVHDEDPECSRQYHSPEFSKPFFDLKDLARSNCIPTCSTVYRTGLFGEFPDWFMGMPMADWPLHILNVQHGPYAYIEEPLAVYRVHGGGIWSLKSRLEILNRTIRAVHIINNHLEDRFSREYGKFLRDMEIEASDILIGQREFGKAFSRLVEAYRASPTSCSRIFGCLWRLMKLWIGHLRGNPE